MAGAVIDVKMDSRAVQKAFDKLAARVGDLRPAMKDIGEYLLKRTAEHFEREQDPDGKDWAPWSDVTLMSQYGRKTRKKDGTLTKGKKTHTKKGYVTAGFERYAMKRKILTLKGHLRKSISYKASRDSLVVGSNEKYAAIHQFGGKAGRGRKVVIPPRPFIGVGSKDEREIERIAQTYLRGR